MTTPLQLLYINIATDGLPAISLAFAPNDKEIMKKPPRKSLIILDQVDFHYIFSVGMLTTVLVIFSFIFHRSLTSVFTILVFIQQFILIDLFLSHRHIVSNYHLLFKPIFLLAFLFPFFLYPLLLYQPIFQQVFRTQPLSIETLLVLSFFSSLILLGIRVVKEFLKM